MKDVLIPIKRLNKFRKIKGNNKWLVYCKKCNRLSKAIDKTVKGNYTYCIHCRVDNFNIFQALDIYSKYNKCKDIKLISKETGIKYQVIKKMIDTVIKADETSYYITKNKIEIPYKR